MENKMKLLLIEDDINTCEIFKKIERARKEIEFIKITNSETEGLKCVKPLESLYPFSNNSVFMTFSSE